MADEDYWFVPKTYGYGAQPKNWKGWAVTLGFVVLMIAITVPLVVFPGEGGPQIFLWLGIQLPLMAAFIWVCHKKTEGGWKWQWGPKK